mgnify:CR=1 FL=1
MIYCSNNSNNSYISFIKISSLNMKTSSLEQIIAKNSLKSIRKLAKTYKNSSKSIEFVVKGEEVAFQVPVSALSSLEAIFENIAKGNESEVVNFKKYFTTQEAAEYLDVSRPFVIRLMEAGELPFIKVGRHRRVLFSDLKKYEKGQQEMALDKMKQLAKESQNLDLY